jgi:arsenate reductase-like glutaredoxin family protein
MARWILGTKKCPDTRKVERFFKDRGVAYQFIDPAGCAALLTKPAG